LAVRDRPTGHTSPVADTGAGRVSAACPLIVAETTVV
jgi:hypothetical protein